MLAFGGLNILQQLLQEVSPSGDGGQRAFLLHGAVLRAGLKAKWRVVGKVVADAGQTPAAP
jgi:hypothetical protein